jgi:hypothetical protein
LRGYDIGTLRKFLMVDQLPTGDLAVFGFLEMVALAFAFEGTGRLLDGRYLPGFLSLGIALLFFVAGIKWPKIKSKASVGLLPYLGPILTLVFLGVTLALFQTLSTQDFVMHLHQRLHGWLGFTVVGLVGATLSCGYWWLTSKMLVSAPTSEETATSDRRSDQSTSLPTGASSDTAGTPQTGAHTVKVTDGNGIPLKGAEIYFIRRNGVHSSKTVSDNAGVAEVMTWNEAVSVFCALDGFFAYYQENYNPGTPLRITLKKSPRGGSVIFSDGTGYITGLSGRLNPILDTLGRTYLYAENIAIDGGKTQPVTFVLNVPMTLEDLDGHRVEIKIVSIISSSSLIDYRRL